ncbi:hypothetical protein P4O66_003706, partial [Electrophorus voltai]
MKCFEKVVRDFITSSLPASMDPLQFAYRHNRSTDDAIAHLLHTTLTHLDKGRALRQQRISKILEAPHITYTHERINMADMMGGGEPHQCEQEVKKQEKVRPDLEGEPIPGARNMFTDGCGFRGPDGNIKTGSVDTPLALLADAPPLEEDTVHCQNWQETVEPHTLASLGSREIERQAVIYELFTTEASHLRTLRVLDQVFFQKMRNLLTV